MTDHPLAMWRRQRGLAQWRLAAAIDLSPETVTAVERGLRRADGVVARMAAVGLIDSAEAQRLREASAAWLVELRRRAREEALTICAG